MSLRWDQLDLQAGLLHVARLKNALASTHPIRGPELRALRELKRDYPSSPYLFVSELGGPMTPATLRKLITRAGEKAKLPLPIHPHMLRHSTGYKLANDGHDTRSIQQYLGHQKITHYCSLHRALSRAVQGIFEGLKTGGLKNRPFFWFSHMSRMLGSYPSGEQDFSVVRDLQRDPEAVADLAHLRDQWLENTKRATVERSEQSNLQSRLRELEYGLRLQYGD